MKICRSSEGFWFVDPDSCRSPLANLLLLADVATKIAEDEEKSKQQRRKRSYGSIQGDSSFMIPEKYKKNEGKVGMKSRKGSKVDVPNVNPRSCCSPLANLLLLADVATKIAEDEEKSKQQRRKRSYGRIQGDSSFMIPKKSKKNERKVGLGSRKGPKVDVPNVNPNPLPELSEEFKHMIEQMAGTEVTMVIQKTLTMSDLKTDNSRLSMPFGQIQVNFLREEEKQNLSQRGKMEVPFMVASQMVGKMILGQWDMRKDSGKMSSMYVLKTYWNEVAKNNELKLDDGVQIWSFRVGDADQLCLALIVVARGGSGTLDSTGSKSNDNDPAVCK